ncbi:MAG: hypothetical protein NVS2B3_04830 [Vulcanimicrobiaceae bacterium]
MNHTAAGRGPIRVYYIPATGTPGVREIANDLASLFDLVGQGRLDVVDLDCELAIFCDECRTERAYAYNFSIGTEHVHGDAFVVRHRDMQIVSLDDADLVRLTASPALRRMVRA